MIRDCQTTDAAAICGIYNHYVLKTAITFEEEPIAEPEMAQRIEDVTQSCPWLVWEESGSILGYAYATRWKARFAYRFSVESTIYVSPGFEGRGIGTRLYQALIAELEERDIHCVISGIALPNTASIALHEKLGFTRIGEFREVGWKFGNWVDVDYWQLILSR